MPFPFFPLFSCITQKSLSLLSELFRLQGKRDCQKALETASASRATLPRTLQFLLLRARAAGLCWGCQQTVVFLTPGWPFISGETGGKNTSETWAVWTGLMASFPLRGKRRAIINMRLLSEEIPRCMLRQSRNEKSVRLQAKLDSLPSSVAAWLGSKTQPPTPSYYLCLPGNNSKHPDSAPVPPPERPFDARGCASPTRRPPAPALSTNPLWQHSTAQNQLLLLCNSRGTAFSLASF